MLETHRLTGRNMLPCSSFCSSQNTLCSNILFIYNTNLSSLAGNLSTVIIAGTFREQQ